jgi:hypothetical protein
MGMNRRQIFDAFWIAEAMLVGLALFFAVVGGAVLDSPVFMLIVLACAIALLLHGLYRNRHRAQLQIAADARRARERRGF